MMHAPVVLLADDSPTISKVVTHTLRRHGIDVVTVPDGPAALAALPVVRPQLVLLDIVLPGLDGYRVCRALRELPEYRQVPVVILSGKDGPIDRLRGRLAGARAHLGKPFEPLELVEVVRAQLGLTGATQLIIESGSSLIVPVRPQYTARAS